MRVFTWPSISLSWLDKTNTGSGCHYPQRRSLRLLPLYTALNFYTTRLKQYITSCGINDLNFDSIAMRLRLIVCFFAFLIALYLLIIRVLNFIGLFYEHSGIALTQSEVVLAHKITSPGDRVPLIPKIIHQVYHDWDKTGMPGDWEKLRQSCREKNKDWQYIVSRLAH